MQPNAPRLDIEDKSSDLTIDLNYGTDELVSIIIVHRDGPGLLNMLLQSIVMTSANNNIEIIVVDNGSTTKDALDYLDALEKEPDIKLVRNEVNRWWAAACNQGARVADRNSRYLLFMHQDCVVLSPAWIDLMISVGESQNSGFVGLEQGHFTYDRKKIPYIREWCLLISRECWKDCGPFVEELKQVGSSFVMTISSQRLGYNPIIVGQLSLVHHYMAFSMDNSEYAKMSEQSAALIPKLINAIQQKSGK